VTSGPDRVPADPSDSPGLPNPFRNLAAFFLGPAKAPDAVRCREAVEELRDAHRLAGSLSWKMADSLHRLGTLAWGNVASASSEGEVRRGAVVDSVAQEARHLAVRMGEIAREAQALEARIVRIAGSADGLAVFPAERPPAS